MWPRGRHRDPRPRCVHGRTSGSDRRATLALAAAAGARASLVVELDGRFSRSTAPAATGRCVVRAATSGPRPPPDRGRPPALRAVGRRHRCRGAGAAGAVAGGRPARRGPGRVSPICGLRTSVRSAASRRSARPSSGRSGELGVGRRRRAHRRGSARRRRVPSRRRWRLRSRPPREPRRRLRGARRGRRAEVSGGAPRWCQPARSVGSVASRAPTVSPCGRAVGILVPGVRT